MLGYFNGYVLYPVLERLVKRNIRPKLIELRAFDALSNEEQLKRQREDLYKLLRFCQENIPYYKELFLKHSFDVEKIKDDIGYLHNLPVLTKEDVREHSEKMKFSKNGQLHIRKTGGSTGQSVFFYYDNEGLDWTAALNLHAYEVGGKKAHHSDSHIGADLDFGVSGFKDRLYDRIRLLSQNRKRLLISSFSDEGLAKSYNQLKSHRPYLLQGHPSSLYAIANYVERQKMKPIRLCRVFEPTGEMVTQKMVESIERNILCQVANRYGNAEFGVIAHTKKGDSYKHLKVFQRAFYVEPCESGPIIVTGLTNYGFPLLRYDTGDIATVTKEIDGYYINDIQGRIHDTVKVGQDIFPTHYIMDYLDHKVGGVREFQILLTKENPFPILNIVPEKIEDKDRILKVIKEKWPEGFEIRFVGFEDLVLQGWRQKFRHIVDVREIK